MRLRLARPLGLAVAAAALAFVGWGALGACSSFGDEADGGPAVDATTADGTADASVDGVAPDASTLDGSQGDGGPGRCGKCEGDCLLSGACVPHPVLTGLPPGLVINGLALRGNKLYVSGQSPGVSGLWIADVPADMATSAVVNILSAADVRGVALSDANVFSTANTTGIATLVKTGLTGGSTESTAYPGTMVVTNTSHVTTATSTSITTCPIGDLAGCTPLTGLPAVDHLAASGTHTCVAASFIASAPKVACRDGSAVFIERTSMNPTAAFAVGAGRVVWADGPAVRSIAITAGLDEKAFNFAAPLGAIDALAIDGTDLFVSKGNDLVRCTVADCSSRERLTAAPSIKHIVASPQYVYFVAGANGAMQVARAPRRH